MLIPAISTGNRVNRKLNSPCCIAWNLKLLYYLYGHIPPCPQLSSWPMREDIFCPVRPPISSRIYRWKGGGVTLFFFERGRWRQCFAATRKHQLTNPIEGTEKPSWGSRVARPQAQVCTPNSFLKHLPKRTITFLRKAFNAMLRRQYHHHHHHH
jgi:hypothetical protein